MGGEKVRDREECLCYGIQESRKNKLVLVSYKCH